MVEPPSEVQQKRKHVDSEAGLGAEQVLQATTKHTERRLCTEWVELLGTDMTRDLYDSTLRQ